MKKTIFSLLLAVISTCTFAQEFKIKKGEVLLDGKPIAKISNTNKGLREYKISNLDGSNTITAYMRICTATVPGKSYIEVVNDDKKANDLDFAKYSPFNIDRSIVQTLFEKEMLTEAGGVQTDKINTFLNGAQTGLGEKYGCKQMNEEKEITDAYQLTIDNSGTVFSKNQPIGYISMITSTGDSKGAVQKYEVTNLSHKTIATWYARAGQVAGYDKFLNEEIFTYDKKVFKVLYDNGGNFIGYSMSKDITAMNIVKKLIGNGYTLGK